MVDNNLIEHWNSECLEKKFVILYGILEWPYIVNLSWYYRHRHPYISYTIFQVYLTSMTTWCSNKVKIILLSPQFSITPPGRQDGLPFSLPIFRRADNSPHYYYTTCHAIIIKANRNWKLWLENVIMNSQVWKITIFVAVSGEREWWHTQWSLDLLKARKSVFTAKFPRIFSSNSPRKGRAQPIPCHSF